MSPWLRLVAATASCVALAGCFPPNDGREPPLDRIYFPVGLALSPDASSGAGADDGGGAGSAPPRWLYVASSDFDLQFNAGALQAYDLDRLREFVPTYCETDADCDAGVCDGSGAPTNDGDPSYTCVDPDEPRPCAGLGEASAADRQLAPGRCGPLDPTSSRGGRPVLAQSIGIGAFVTDLLYRSQRCDDAPCSPFGRLFLPVRGDATLHWIDVNPTATSPGLECGQGSGDACDDAHRRGVSPDEENTRDLSLPPEPYGVGADAPGNAILVTHQVNGQVSLFVNDWGTGSSGGPKLTYVLDGLPSGAVATAAIPEPKVIGAVEQAIRENVQKPGGGAYTPIPHEPGFLVTFRNSTEIRLVRYFDDAAAEPERAFLEASRIAQVDTNSVGFDSRGVAIDDSQRAACEARCDEDGELGAYVECLREEQRCASVPLDVFVANRTPATLVLGTTQPNSSEVSSDDLPDFYDTVSMAAGASRVVVGDVIGEDGALERRVFVVCFDSRKIYVWDPRARLVETIIPTGRGPQAIAVDSANGLAYVAHFTDSYVGVVDLDRRHRARYGQMILSMGTPTPPRASK